VGTMYGFVMLKQVVRIVTAVSVTLGVKHACHYSTAARTPAHTSKHHKINSMGQNPSARNFLPITAAARSGA
jgi:hypothetical protein